MSSRTTNVDPFEIIQTVDEPLFVLNESYAIVFGNRAFDTTFGVNRMEIEGKSVYSIGGGMFDLPLVKEKFEHVFKERKVLESFELDHVFPKAGRRTFTINASIMRRYGNANTEQMVVRFIDITEKIAAERAIRQKTQEILELSTPISKIWDEILILPLIGTLDTVRADKMIAQLLDAIRRESARYIIMDGTAVSSMDETGARNIIKATVAVKLLGAHVIMTGIKPEVAMTMVQLGIELRDIQTRATLQEGVQYALESRGYLIMLKGAMREEQQINNSRDSERPSKSTLRLISPYREP
ncbi:MAG: STAS domain-containing protein [Methanospirillum sp.]|uniref:STAS domain-containing protein n=1 Tax=Methanospirillum sp. TaxID=45200 RepID=UPI00236E0400|nr:STAS domain-containing protein [Methanospirillum sp.]MDD1730218.1 STAS domain-containing protein [Methanospirillum sp.]